MGSVSYTSDEVCQNELPVKITGTMQRSILKGRSIRPQDAQ